MMGSDQYCLKWNNHWANLIRVFNSLLASETFTDVTLACEGHQIKAHKLVLSASSPYFKELLVSHPDRHPIVILKDVRYTELQAIIQFIYNGYASVEQQELPALLSTAKELQIKGLAETLEGVSPTSLTITPGSVDSNSTGKGSLSVVSTDSVSKTLKVISTNSVDEHSHSDDGDSNINRTRRGDGSPKGKRPRLSTICDKEDGITNNKTEVSQAQAGPSGLHQTEDQVRILN